MSISCDYLFRLEVVVMDLIERMRLKTLHDQEQEWAEGAAWYAASKLGDVVDFIDKMAVVVIQTQAFF